MATKCGRGLRRHLKQVTSFLGIVALSALAVLLVQHLLTPPHATARSGQAQGASTAMVMQNPTVGQSAPGSGTCSNATLNGTYGVQTLGFYLTGPDGTPLAAPTWRSQVNLVTADGAGNVSRGGGVGGTLPRPASGTYTVDPDCTFAVTWTLPTTTTGPAGVLVNGGAKAFAIPADAGQAITWERR